MKLQTLLIPAALWISLPACSTTASSASYVATDATGADTSQGDVSTNTTKPQCFDAAAKATDVCAFAPTGDVCSLGDANACTPLTQIQVYADDGKNGACLHLVFQNNCSGEIFADTCIERTNAATGKVSSQCWTSSVLPGFKIDVSQCQATGKYFQVASLSSGQLDILEQKCSAPQ